MSARSPIQVPEELKNEIESMKNRMYARTNYEVIDKLIKYYQANEAQKARERERQKAEDINLGEDLKKELVQFRDQMRLNSDAAAVTLLLDHFKRSDKLSKETFDLYRSLI